MTKIHNVSVNSDDIVNDNSFVKKKNVLRLSKPLIEKRRRARINTCLMQLKEMVIDSGEQSSQVGTHFFKTVKYI